jgi:hypothetical protein
LHLIGCDFSFESSLCIAIVDELIELRYEQVSLCRLVVLVGIDTVLAQCKVLYKRAIGAAQVRNFSYLFGFKRGVV